MKIIKRILCVSVIVTALAFQMSCENGSKPKMVKIPGQHYEMMTTEVTQGLYESVMGENPSCFRNDNEDLDDEKRDNLPENTKNNPVENVSWYDAIYFCNLLSKSEGLEPVYAVNGKKNVSQWNYKPHRENEIEGKITQDVSADGYRLPSYEEWVYAARGGQYYKYAGSNYLDEVGWYSNNSGNRTHTVAQKKANGYGLYDMSGNVWEWCWDGDVIPYIGDFRDYCGGCWGGGVNNCGVCYVLISSAYSRNGCLGFRLVRTIK